MFDLHGDQFFQPNNILSFASRDECTVGFSQPFKFGDHVPDFHQVGSLQSRTGKDFGLPSIIGSKNVECALVELLRLCRKPYAVAIGLIDNNTINKLSDPSLYSLQVIATVRHHQQQEEIYHTVDFNLGLSDANGFNQYDVVT